MIAWNHNDGQQPSPIKPVLTTKLKTRSRGRASGSRKPVSQASKIKTSVLKDVSGTVAGTMTVWGSKPQVRAAVSEQSKRATDLTRRLGACKRCRKHQKRCDMPENIYLPCKRCQPLLASMFFDHSTKLNIQPCVRIGLLELSVHRKGPMIVEGLHSWAQEKQQLLKYQAVQNDQWIFLTQGFGEADNNPLCLYVSRFEPRDGDRTAFHWTDPSGYPRSMELPPYFISNMEAALMDLKIFVQSARHVYIDALLKDSDPIIRHTFQAAQLHASTAQHGLLSVALDLWVSSRLIESQWRIYCGAQSIGIDPACEPGHPYDGYAPITPMIDTQLDDLILRHLISPLSILFLAKLKDRIDERKPENWLEIYLAMFIMLSNMGWITKDMLVQATWKGLKPGNRGGTLTQGFMHACKTMLSYFHFACAGSVPLSIACNHQSQDSKGIHGITSEQLQYLKSVKREMARQAEKFSNWAGLSMYEDDAYWCYQLLSTDWQGDVIHAGEIDDFAEEDFLSSSTT